jgi:hypothetical protein
MTRPQAWHCRWGRGARLGGHRYFSRIASLVNTASAATLKCRFHMEGMPNGVDDCMLDMMVMGILGGLAALVAFEIYQEVRGSSRQLEDRYHE